jgi:hypothetical protein
MTQKMIKLSKKIVISTEQDLIDYQVERWYSEYFKEYDYQLEHLGVAVGQQTTVQSQLKIMEVLEGTYAARIVSKIIQSKPFTDFFDYNLKTPSVKTTSFGYKREQPPPELTVYLITEPFELLESFGHVLILKHPTPQNGNNTISIELNESTSIYSIE